LMHVYRETEKAGHSHAFGWEEWEPCASSCTKNPNWNKQQEARVWRSLLTWGSEVGKNDGDGSDIDWYDFPTLFYTGSNLPDVLDSCFQQLDWSTWDCKSGDLERWLHPSFSTKKESIKATSESHQLSGRALAWGSGFNPSHWEKTKQQYLSWWVPLHPDHKKELM
jgi:hypothetical protein